MQMMPANLEELTKGLTTKSDKIRALAKHGLPTADIARYLNIKYQHARNVLMDCALHKAKGPRSKSAMAQSFEVAKEPSSLWTEIGTGGVVVFSENMLKQAGLAAGDRVYIAVTKDGLELLSRASALRRAQTIAESYKVPGFSVVDDFIANRRKEWGEEES